MSSKLVKTTVTILIILLVAAIVALVVVLNIPKDKNQGSAQTIDEMIENSYRTSEITTDLKDGSFVRIQFQIITDSNDAKEEVKKREFQLKNIIIKQLSTMTEKDFRGGLTAIEDKLQSELNKKMQEGKIMDIYTISKILR